VIPALNQNLWGQVLTVSQAIFWWSGLRAGLPAPLPPVPSRIRLIETFDQRVIRWSGRLISSATPGPPSLITHVDPGRARIAPRRDLPSDIEPVLAQVVA
jgi:hypothetical protein